MCWGRDPERSIDTAHRLWANSGVPGELSQVLPSPKHFEQVSELVTREMTRDAIAYGPDVDKHVAGCQSRSSSDLGARSQVTGVGNAGVATCTDLDPDFEPELAAHYTALHAAGEGIGVVGPDGEALAP